MVLDYRECQLGSLVGLSVGVERTLGAEELARDVEGLAADNDDLLTAEKLLGDDTGETTEEVTLAVNDDLVPLAPVFRPSHVLLISCFRWGKLTTDSKDDILP